MNDGRSAGLLSIPWAAWLLLLGGCTTSKAITADEPRPQPAPRDLASAAPQDTAPRPLDTAPLQTAPRRAPTAPLALGAACSADDRQHCGTKGRVAVVTETRNGPPKRDAPCSMEPLLPPDPMLDHGAGCVKDDRVYLTSNCTLCRVFSIWEMTGVVAEMSDAQLVEAQKRVGLGGEDVLRTPEKWRTAIASAAANARRKR